MHCTASCSLRICIHLSMATGTVWISEHIPRLRRRGQEGKLFGPVTKELAQGAQEEAREQDWRELLISAIRGDEEQ